MPIDPFATLGAGAVTVDCNVLDKLFHMKETSPLLRYILDFYQSRIFSGDINVDAKNLPPGVVMPSNFEETVNDEWRRIFERDVFPSIVVCGMCVVRYSPVDGKRDAPSISTRLRNDDETYPRRRAFENSTDVTAPKDGTKATKTMFHVIPMTEVRVSYRVDYINNTVESSVFPRHANGMAGMPDEPISNTRLLYVPGALSGRGDRIISLLSTVYEKLLVHEHMMLEVSTAMSGMAAPDYGYESVVKEQPREPESETEFAAAESAFGIDAARLRGERLADNIRHSELARRAALAQREENENVDATYIARAQNYAVLRGTGYDRRPNPIWVDRPGMRLADNSKLVH